MECPKPHCKGENMLGIVYRDKKGKPMMVAAKCLKCGGLYGAEMNKSKKAIPAKDQLAEIQKAA